ncbi:hypothetical protein COU88_00140 [Candidatus Roizmanbacteria bacterium CG10_big_fil_rev_8_21_14_0_10_39_6]|uniref:Uncharacterized protein n=1 Tax=Candidatus Roizmanbacteria bacterium CG10_big_fil_rev_8_21_14_0_10_39_6 TaxID=1974853 RepID=A0A2M8KTR6_9BACT|nr:MAG: hypothetical protein COU88_00140 [Candidatus Roizmanbacteria bacterium CG10_big_fil_rev_8_21_14_0_10_39_6]
MSEDTTMPPEEPSKVLAEEIKPRESSWILIVLAVTFFIIVGSSYGLYRVIQNTHFVLPSLSQLFTKKQPQEKIQEVYKTEFRSAIPSSCGYWVGWPTTVIQADPMQEWLYEETAVGSDSFRNLAPRSVTNQGVLMATMQFKKTSEKFKNNEGKKEYDVKHPGLVSYCVNNTQKWDLKTFVEYIEKNSTDQLTYTLNGKKVTWGKIELQPITVEGILFGGYVNEPFYVTVLPVDSDFSRLVVFQPWKAHEERLETDRKALQKSLKSRTIESVLVIPSSGTQTNTQQAPAQQASSCTQFKIYEGEFASDKCYQTQDLEDLKYYLQRYNSAIFSQNAAARSSKITCNGSDFFKDNCDRAKQQYDQALKDQETYKAQIQAILGKGT